MKSLTVTIQMKAVKQRFPVVLLFSVYIRRVKEAIHIRLHPDNINRDNEIEIPEAWMPTIKQHSSRSVPRRTAEGTISSLNDKD